MDYEIAIVGAGPAGLQAAISAATDGLSCVVIEKGHIGGAIRHTPRLENVAFAPVGGLTGQQFADNMEATAREFGVKFIHGSVRDFALDGPLYRLHYVVGRRAKTLVARFIIVAVGGLWKDVEVKGIEASLADGRVQYGPAGSRDGDWTGQYVVVVGGGPAAGQCIVEAARTARSVRVLLRQGFTCPDYLVRRIEACQNVQVFNEVDIHEFDTGDDGHYVCYALPSAPGVVKRDRADKVFLCAGVVPDTGWLKHSRLALTEGGRLQTMHPSYQTNVENVFVIGDCRDGSTARVCSALGEGSSCITEIHQIRNTRIT